MSPHIGADRRGLAAWAFANDAAPPVEVRAVAAGPVFTVRGRPDASIPPHETLLRWTELLSRAPILSGVDPQQAYLDHGKF